MAKAKIITKAGTKITIEGDPTEVAAIVQQVQGEGTALPTAARESAGMTRRAARHRQTPTNLIALLIEGGFFRKPKDLAAVKVGLGSPPAPSHSCFHSSSAWNRPGHRPLILPFHRWGHLTFLGAARKLDVLG